MIKDGGFDIIGIGSKITNEEGRAANAINTLWQGFYNDNIIDRIPDKQGAEVYAVYSDYEGDHTKPYRVTIGCRVPDSTDIPVGLVKTHIKKAEYRIFPTQGEQPKALVKGWTEIWESNLPRVFGTDFEVYGPKFFEPNVHEVLIYIGMHT